MAAALALLFVGVTSWLLFVPVNAYRELGPAHRRAPCGSVVDPLEPYASHDEVCFDELYAKRHVAYLTGALAALLILGTIATSPTITARFRRPSPPDQTDRWEQLERDAYRRIGDRVQRGTK